MKLEMSEILGRISRTDSPDTIGNSSLDYVEAAMQDGDIELAKDRLEYARKEWEIVHDMYANWSTSFFTYIQKNYGEDAVEDAMRKILGSYYKSRYDKAMAADTETQLQLTIEGLRGHLMGEGRRGELGVIDKGKYWEIELAPCSSGGIINQRLAEGTEPNPELFGVSEQAHDWTWGKKGVGMYCGHCAFVNEILSIENYGHPMRITQHTSAADGSCTWLIYKDPKDIPAEYYERVGKKAPEHAPRLADEG